MMKAKTTTPVIHNHAVNDPKSAAIKGIERMPGSFRVRDRVRNESGIDDVIDDNNLKTNNMMTDKESNKEIMRMASSVWMQSFSDVPPIYIIKYLLRRICDLSTQMDADPMVLDYINEQFNPTPDAVTEPDDMGGKVIDGKFECEMARDQVMFAVDEKRIKKAM